MNRTPIDDLAGPTIQLMADIAKDHRADPIAETVIDLSHKRARAEIELLANVFPAMRQGLFVLNDIPITIDHFENDDTRIIFASLELASRFPQNRNRAVVIRDRLAAAGFWNNEDTRDFIGGMIWGPGPLATLFTRLQFDRGRLMLAAARLYEAIDQQERFIQQHRRAA